MRGILKSELANQANLSQGELVIYAEQETWIDASS